MNPMEPRSARQEQEVSEGYGFRTVQDVSGRITQTRIRNQQVARRQPPHQINSSKFGCCPTYGASRRGVMANEVGPARGKPITLIAHNGRCHRLAPLCADSIMARSPKVLQRRGRSNVCSPSLSPIRSLTRSSDQRQRIAMN
jgi:hypothetical protein